MCIWYLIRSQERQGEIAVIWVPAESCVKLIRSLGRQRRVSQTPAQVMLCFSAWLVEQSRKDIGPSAHIS